MGIRPTPSSSVAHFLQGFLCLLFFLCVAPLNAQRGALTQPRNLAELVDQSDRIIRGRVTAVRVEPHPEMKQIFSVVVSIRVEETLKGASEETFTFRQFIWDIRDRRDAAGYRKGQALLLLLNPQTSLGLRTPAGVEQGRFRISRNAQGAAVAANGVGNVGLLRGIEGEAKKRGFQIPQQTAARIHTQVAGPIPLDDLTALIRGLAK